MTRRSSDEFKQEIVKKVTYPVFLTEFELASLTMFLCTGPLSVTWRGNVYQHLNINAGFTNLDEQGEGKSGTLTYTLAGFAMDENGQLLLQQFDRYTRQGGINRLWFGLINPITSQLIRDPKLLIQGIIDVPTGEDDPDSRSGSIAVTVVSRRTRQKQRQGRRYTDQDQKFYFPLDRGFEFVSELQEITL